MIQYTCLKCSSTVAAEDGKEGQADSCPNCGNVNVVPGTPKPQAPSPAPGPTTEARTAGGTSAPGSQEPVPAGPVTEDKDARTWAMLSHLGGLCLVPVPFGNIIVPLVIWLIQKDKSPFIDDQGKESVNFQITVSIAILASMLLAFAVIGAILLPAVVIADVVLVIMAAIKSNEGFPYRYPLCIRFIK